MSKTAAHVVRRRGRRDANGAFGLGTTTPSYAWDFVNNKARFNNINYGALANTPGWTATPATHSAGGVLYASTASGALQSFASGELRRTDKGVLIEGTRTNLCLQSQTFDNASWTKTRCSITANAVDAPDGTTTADAFVEDASAASNRRVAQAVTKAASAITYTQSCYLKASARNYAVLYSESAGGTALTYFNIATGVISTAAAVTGAFTSPSATITALANGWYRCTQTFTTDTNTTVDQYVFGSGDGSTLTYNGVNGQVGFYLWGAQLEAAAFPSSYIPTTTASATRAADVLSVPVSGLTYPLSLYAEFERAVDTGGTETLLEVDDNSAANYVRLFVNSSDQAASSVNAASASQGGVAVTGALALATVYKAAVRVGANTLQTCRGGTLGTEDTSVTLPATPTHIHFGANEAAANPCFSYLRRVAIWPRALTDAELQAVTL